MMAKRPRCPKVRRSALNAVETEFALRVGQLAGVLHEETRLTDEFAGLLRGDPRAALAPVFRLDDAGLFLLVVVLVLGRRDPVLQDRVEVGFDVIGVGLVVVLGVLFAVGLGLP